MKEIGGYFELEKGIGKEYYDLLRFNSSRNALQFIIRKRNIKKMYLPYYMCLVVEQTLLNENVEICYYHIDNNFIPIINDYDGSYVYIANFFGLLSKSKMEELANKYSNKVIIDNTHGFFMNPWGNIDIIYNCRKYFGVPDGAYLYTDLEIDNDYPLASSMSRIKHLFGRFESDGSSYYNDYTDADETFANQDIYLMSKITRNMLLNIDYGKAKATRDNNFNYLYNEFKSINKLNIDLDASHDFMYPLLISNGKDLKKYLISNKIYVPLLWPNIDKFDLNDFELNIFNNLVLLPIDQRYNIDDMTYVVNKIKEFLNEKD